MTVTTWSTTTQLGISRDTHTLRVTVSPKLPTVALAAQLGSGDPSWKGNPMRPFRIVYKDGRQQHIEADDYRIDAQFVI